MCLAEEIGGLLQLECLKVSLYKYANNYIERKRIKAIIPRSILSKFSHLIELLIPVYPDCEWWDAEVEAIINELPQLRKLGTLELYFPTLELLQKFLQHLGNGIVDRIGKALEHAGALFLHRQWTIEKLSAFKIDEMHQLKFCLVVECNEMNTIVDGGDFYQERDNDGKPILGLLRYLSVHYMKNLQSIWKGPFVANCPSFLEILALHTCPELTTIFNLALLHSLINLKELIVENCPKVKSLISVDPSSLEADSDFLPALEKILILDLPESNMGFQIPFSTSKGSLKVLLLHGNLDIWVYKAKNLLNMNILHKTLGDVHKLPGKVGKITSDLFVSISVTGAVIGRTYMIRNSENLIWMQHFSVPVAHYDAEVHFYVYGQRHFGVPCFRYRCPSGGTNILRRTWAGEMSVTPRAGLWVNFQCNFSVLRTEPIQKLTQARVPNSWIAPSKVYGYRMSLWAEHLGCIDDCFTERKSLKCVRRVRSMGEMYWNQFEGADITKMKVHLLKYPVEVKREGR
ncbi:hypothetical protein LguiB_005826 [Lonicera macranthoides]